MGRYRRYVGHARRPITEYELLDLLSASRPRGRVCWLLAADGGLRRAEIADLRPEDVQATRIRIRRGKGNVSRWTVNTERVQAAIAAADFWAKGGAYEYSAMGNMFRRDAGRAGISRDISLHCLRHRFATQLCRRGVPLMDISSLLGHSDLGTTAVYLHDSEDRFDRARAALSLGDMPDGYPQFHIPFSDLLRG